MNYYYLLLLSQQVEALAADIKTGLTSLPTENQIGGEDIYGLDTRVYFRSGDFEWMNGSVIYIFFSSSHAYYALIHYVLLIFLFIVRMNYMI